ncbi:MAG: hypothetical protein CM15mP1_1020 [Methanobacteriota archaeon]|nr:MAG: hypothetical protein CM15mP1_1020 [Euryarchaeota archaeon]
MLTKKGSFAITNETKALCFSKFFLLVKDFITLPIFSFFLSFAKRSKSLISLPGSLSRLLIFLINFSFLLYILILSHAGFCCQFNDLYTCSNFAYFGKCVRAHMGTTHKEFKAILQIKFNYLLYRFCSTCFCSFAVAQPKN